MLPELPSFAELVIPLILIIVGLSISHVDKAKPGAGQKRSDSLDSGRNAKGVLNKNK